MNKIIYNYHTHTKRCGHACGEDEEYVKSAIKLGIKRLGFSDHIILPEGFSQPTIRGDFNQLNDYLSSINYLKNKYKDQIEILIGFEAEYFPELVDYYKDLLNNKIDYLIMGQHCRMENSKFQWYFSKDSTPKDIHIYVDEVLAGLKTGMFKYLAHPDLFMLSFDGWDETMEYESRRLLKGCEELNIPVEINICGMRRKYYDGFNHSYPNHHFYDLIKEYNLKVVLGLDAHNPEHINQEAVDMGFTFAKRHGLTIDEDFNLL